MPRHNLFTNSEMTDMVAIYAQQNFSERAAARSYADTYPNRRQPNRKLFSRLFSRLRETGSFGPSRYYGRPVNQQLVSAECLLMLESRSTTSRILHEQQLRAYHYSPAQNLLPGDFLARMQFCEFILRRNRQDAYFRDIQQKKLSHWLRHFQHEFKINIWCGIIESCGSFRTPSKIEWSGLSKLPSRKFSRFTRRSSFRRSC
ncbi:hypothetical protein NQ318_023176 [Aromia moschata]|uniref:DUF4817 domain-containing protein n=1 Tax=Aromia moschata TaxID=1265417 RepID=A0AAV8Y137_9CUCU|nr:hypothetical protein NQ318_023176 [Aromia moschata]